MYAFVDRESHYYVRVGSFTIHRTPTVQIILDPPRMEERFVPEHPQYPKIVQAFLKAADTYGGDPIAINLFKEHLQMATTPHFVISTVLGAAVIVAARVGTAKKAAELVAATAGLVAVKTKEEFEALAQPLRLAIADLDEKVKTLPEEEKLARAFEVLSKYEIPVVKKAKAVSKGVKSLIRDLFAVAGAKHSVAEIIALTGGTEVSVKTALSDLRSPKYCVPGEPLEIGRIGDKYQIISKADQEAAKAKAAAEKKAAADSAKAEKAAKAANEKAAKKAAADAEKAAKAAAAPAAAAPADKGSKGKKAA